MSFSKSKEHKCSLDLEADNVLLAHNATVCSGLRRFYKWFVISKKHPHTYRHFRSYATLVAERQRHLTEGSRCIVHPLSNFSLYWNSFIALVYISHMFVAPFRLSFVLHLPGAPPQLHAADHALLALQLLGILDILVQLQTGYIDKNSNAVLNRLRIAGHYAQRYLVIDLLSSLFISYILLTYKLNAPRYMIFALLLPNLKIFTICRDLKRIVNLFERFHATYMVYGCVRNVILFFLSVHLLTCLTYTYCVTQYYWWGVWPSDYQRFLTANSTTLPYIDIEKRYKKASFLCFAAFFGTSYATYHVYQPVEVMTNCFTILYAALFMVYVLVFLIKVYMTKYNSIIRYYELMDQLKEYMRHKKFPSSLKKRVIAFYYYRYQGTYFREDRVLSGLSDQLRNEIALFTCNKLIAKVALFDGLPPGVVGAMLGFLRAEVFLPNDLVMRAGDIGDCMYLIANGTVAVYSLMGVEVCHLEDGAYFGEVALLMKDSKRVATVVAIEITQVYRLEADHFRYFIETYAVLYERIEALASQRMNETVLLDDAFKREREREHSTSRPHRKRPASHHNLSRTTFSRTSNPNTYSSK